MARRNGRPPLSAEIIELRGNPSKMSRAQIDARRESTPQPQLVRAATPPADLSPYARECWELHAPELDALGLLSVLDRGAFRLMCECYSLAREALDEMRPRKADGTPDGRRRRHEIIVDDPAHSGRKRHPALLVFDTYQRAYEKWVHEFGLTPQARVGIRPAAGGRPVPGDEGDGGDHGDTAFFGA
jgi:P27 family predicted phage terminase small subunit